MSLNGVMIREPGQGSTGKTSYMRLGGCSRLLLAVCCCKSTFSTNGDPSPWDISFPARWPGIYLAWAKQINKTNQKDLPNGIQATRQIKKVVVHMRCFRFDYSSRGYFTSITESFLKTLTGVKSSYHFCFCVFLF